MSSQQQQHNAYLPGYTQVAHHEWRDAPNSAAYLLPHLAHLSTSATSPPALLDVGAGPGTLSASLATYLPLGHVTATDLSPEILDRAKVYAAEKGVQNISFRPASIYDLTSTFGEEKFDVVHAHQVLTHLDSPVQALTQMLAVLKPGGVLAVREVDLRVWSFFPETKGLRDWVKVLLETHEATGGIVMAGPSLLHWAVEAGVSREKIKMGMGTWCFADRGGREVWGGTFRDRTRSGGMRTKALELGLATEAQMDEMADEWQRWIDTEDACCGTMHGEMLVWK